VTLTATEYIAKIKEFVVVPEEHMEAYLTTLLASEAGECIGLYGKSLRGDFPDLNNPKHSGAYLDQMLKELGDVCFGLCLLADMFSTVLNTDQEEMDDEDSALSSLFSWANDVLGYQYNGGRYGSKRRSIEECWECFLGVIDFYGFTLEQVMQANIDKLAARKAKGTIMGSGERE